jgi:hypothetical protein
VNRTRRLSAALVAVAFIVPCVVATGASAKKATLKVATSQKKALQRDGLQVKVKGLKSKGKKKAKVKIKARSSTFDQQDLRNLTKAAKVRTKKKSAVALLQLTNNGRKSITSCESRKIVISGKGVKKAKVQLKRNTKECKPKPIDLSRADDCNFIGVQEGSLCMLPFPDDYYTVKDSSSSTGRRIAFTDGGMPQNEDGKPIAAEPYNLNDGFSPGQVITLKVPGLDNPEALTKTNPIPLADLSRNESQDSKEPIVVIDAETGTRTPIWVEIDSNASTPSSTALLIHAATQFEAGHRYIVAMRKLKDSSGNKLAAPEGFRYYRDDLPSNEAAINDQRKRMDKVFRALRKVKVKRANLYLAWDFTVSSDENVAQRMLHIRNDAFAQLGDTNLGDGVVEGTAPAFAIDTVANNPNPGIARRVTGTFTVPCYLTNSCEAPAVFTLDSSGNPIRQGNYQANFDCIIPDAAVATPGRPSLYGHGLLGSAGEVGSAPQRSLANTHNFVFCATDEIGFANEDIGNTIGILGDLGRFPELTDRTQQGLLNELFLGRLMVNPGGLLSDEAFHADGTTLGSPPVINTSKLYYNGNSQGGILGGALTAISPDFTRASLGVPAMGYSTLLTRSIDFETYSQILYPSYPNELSRPLALSLIQMLWDRSEANGYAHRMTDNPLPGTPQHEVLMNIAFGDHQVTTWQADVQARTIGASIHTPVVYDGRWPGVDVGWGIPTISSYPFSDSAIVYWDGGPVRPDPGNPGEVLGTDPPPLTNTPNTSGEDPHGLPRATPEEQQMVSDFLRPDAQSQITDTCNGGPCFSIGFSGP